MNQKPDNTTAPTDHTVMDFSSWRKEVETFCRQVFAQLHDIVNTDEATGATGTADTDTPSRAARDVPAQGVPRATPDSKPSAVESSSSASPVAPPDLDTSQDRLANLKRELAAKLSKRARNDESLDT